MFIVDLTPLMEKFRWVHQKYIQEQGLKEEEVRAPNLEFVYTILYVILGVHDGYNGLDYLSDKFYHGELTNRQYRYYIEYMQEYLFTPEIRQYENINDVKRWRFFPAVMGDITSLMFIHEAHWDEDKHDIWPNYYYRRLYGSFNHQ